MSLWNPEAIQQALRQIFTDTTIIGLTLASLAVGAVVLLSLARKHRYRNFLVSAAVGGIFLSLYSAAPSATHFTRFYAINLALGAASFGALYVCLTLWFQAKGNYGGDRIASHLRGVLFPSYWPDAIALGNPDIIKRGYVTISAATGATVGMLLTEDVFRRTALEYLKSPTHLVSIGLLTVIVFMLLGPGEEYVLHSSASHGRSGQITNPRADAFVELFVNTSWRAVGRLALVVIVSFGILTVHGCLERTIQNVNLDLLTMTLRMALGAGLIAFYWSAALQMCSKSLAGQAARSVLTAALIFEFIALIAPLPRLMTVNLLSFPVVFVFLALMIAIFPLIIFLRDAIPAYIGGYTIQWARDRHMRPEVPILAISVVMGLWSSMLTGGFISLLNFFVHLAGRSFENPLDAWELYVAPIAISFLMAIGLVVSGFPQIFDSASRAFAVQTPNLSAERGEPRPAAAFDPFKFTLNGVYAAIGLVLVIAIIDYLR